MAELVLMNPTRIRHGSVVRAIQGRYQGREFLVHQASETLLMVDGIRAADKSVIIAIEDVELIR